MAPHIDYEKLPTSNNDLDEAENFAQAPQTTCTHKQYILIFLLMVSNICTWFISEWRVTRGGDHSGSLSPYGIYCITHSIL